MSTRTISWYESTYDLEKISENQWQFQIAKLVVTAEGSPPVSNVIWKSLALQPLATISWPVKYGLNWSTNPPTDGVTVTVGGRWQACDKGQAFDLTKLGEWTPSATSGTPGWLTVGNIEYAYPGGNGINIVIGVQNGTAWEPIFIDPTNLPPGSSGSYQPQEEAKWWLENSNLTGSVYSKTRGSVGSVDLTNPAPLTNKYAYWTTYEFDSGKWVNSQTAPSDSDLAPPAFAPEANGVKGVEVISWPWIGFATLTAAVTAARLATVRADLKAQLTSKYAEVKVEWEGTSGTKINFTLSMPRKNLAGSRAAPRYKAAADPLSDVIAALNAVNHEGVFPPNESWTVTSQA